MSEFSIFNGYTVKDATARKNIEFINQAILNEINDRKNRDNNLQSQINSLSNGSPLVADSTSEMTDTNRIYVNITDGKWYYYDGTEWVEGGTYQSTGIDPTDPVIANINLQLSTIRTKPESKQLFNYNDFIEDKNLQNTYGTSTPNDLSDSDGIFVTNTIIFDEPLTENTDFSTNIQTVSRCLTYVLSDDEMVREGNYTNTNFVNDATNNNKKITINASQAHPIVAIRISALMTANPYYKNLYFCKTSEYYDNFNTEYIDYYKLNDYIDIEHLKVSNPIFYNGNEVNTFYKGIAIGDSLTEGTFNTTNGFINHKQYAYPMYFYKKTGVILRNFGVGGSTAQSWYERYQNITFPVYDMCIIALGVNDLIQGVQTSTTIQYINNIVDKLKSQNNKVKCFIATINKAYKTTTNWESLNTAIREYVKSTSNCYLLDIAKYGLTDIGTPFVNGHLTAIGYNQLANEYANLISYNMYKNSEEFTDIQFSGTEYTNLPTD